MSTWVLLRGLARDSRHWGNFPALLAAALPDGSRVLALDLPGNGALHAQRSPCSVAGMVDAYRDMLKAERPIGGLNVLGLSLGAMVAIEWAHRYPGELESVVLVNGSVGGLSAPSQRLLPAAAVQLALSAVARDDLARERRIIAACSNRPDSGIAAALWARLAAGAHTNGLDVARQLVAAARFRLPAARPRVPLLVLASTAYRVVSVECSIALARAWSLPILLHPGAGHELALDDAAWLARQCGRWVGGLHVPHAG